MLDFLLVKRRIVGKAQMMYPILDNLNDYQFLDSLWDAPGNEHEISWFSFLLHPL